MTKKCIILSIAVFTAVATLAQTPKTVQSKLESATILRVGAELVHTAKVPLVSGNNELVIEGLSASVDVNSLQIKCSGGTTVIGSEFLKDYLSGQKESEAMKKMADSIKYYLDEGRKLSVIIEANKELKILLNENKAIAGTQNGLKVEELMKMMDYYKSKSIEIDTESNDYKAKSNAFRKRYDLLKSQYDQEKKKNDKVGGRLKLKLVSPVTNTYDITVSYYTPAAYWVPFYDLQAFASDKPIKLASKAKFMQTTGLDWEKVDLTLSTATPSNGKTAPVFNAWFVNFVPKKDWISIADLTEHKIIMESSDKVAVQSSTEYMMEMPLPAKPTEPIYVINGVVASNEAFKSIDPNMIANIDVIKETSAIRMYGPSAAAGAIVVTTKTNFVSESENQSDVTYKIDLPYNVLGNGSEQSVTLRTIDIPAKYQYYCAPKLDKTVYLLAGIRDWAQYNLLPGEASITYDGTYSGKSYIDPNSTMDVLQLTLGSDKRITVKREKMQDFSSTKMLGSDKRQVFTYLLTVKNNKNIPVDMILKDQYPISMDKSIVVELLETANANVNEQVGTLTWEFPLGVGETRTFKISYSVKYPKDREIDF